MLWLLIGLAAGAVARLAFMGGIVPALLLGIAGALAGGFLAVQLAGGAPSVDASLLSAAAGAALFLIGYCLVLRARSR